MLSFSYIFCLKPRPIHVDYIVIPKKVDQKWGNIPWCCLSPRHKHNEFRTVPSWFTCVPERRIKSKLINLMELF
uniref:Uncharacterized protein n=1 Tax=Pararge aegeria TaxID=116150 RepID=S4P4U3_9NEOP